MTQPPASPAPKSRRKRSLSTARVRRHRKLEALGLITVRVVLPEAGLVAMLQDGAGLLCINDGDRRDKIEAAIRRFIETAINQYEERVPSDNSKPF